MVLENFFEDVLEDVEILNVPLIDGASLSMLLLRFFFNVFFVWIIIHKLYYPRSKRSDYYFTFALISISIFFLIYLLGSIKIKVGFALGLFAIFGIIRYRTESMSVREMTYLFVIIAISVINALAVTLSYVELIITNVIFLISIYVFEHQPVIKNLSEKHVLYDKIDLIKPEREEELIADLRKRLGIDVVKVEVGAVDFIRDTVMIKVYYDTLDKQENSVNKLFKLPKREG